MSPKKLKSILFIILVSATVLLASTYFFLGKSIIPTGKSLFREETADFEVDQILIKVLVREDESITMPIRIMNIGEKTTTIRVEPLGLEDILTIPEPEFTIKPGQTKILQMDFSSFNEEKGIKHQPDVYTGKLSVRSETYKEEIPVIVEIESEEVLFDMNLNNRAGERDVVQGRNTIVEVRIFNLMGTGPASVDVGYFVKDLNGNTVITESETVVIETQASFFKTFYFPKNMRPGSYVFTSRVKYGSSVGTSSYLFEVIPLEKPILDISPRLILLLASALISLILIIAISKYVKRKKLKIPEVAFGAPDVKKRIQEVEDTLKMLKQKDVDTSDLKLELELVKQKLDEGMPRMARWYLTRLEKKLPSHSGKKFKKKK